MQVIYLVKNIKSEQTFDVTVGATASGDRPATVGVDYTIGQATQDVEFRFDQDKLTFPIGLNEDDIPEGTETFQLISLATEADFNPSVNDTTTIFILDNDGESMSFAKPWPALQGISMTLISIINFKPLLLCMPVFGNE